MKPIHLPAIDARYWAGILLASVFGTNLGDLYAHDSGLGIGPGLALVAACFLLERRDDRRHEIWYWLVILIIRTGATNIGDFLAFRLRVPPVALAVGLVLLLAGLAVNTHLRMRRTRDETAQLPATDGIYWMAMLTAGVLGTVLGDDCSHFVGQGAASLLLGGALLAALLAIGRKPASILAYWAIIGIARTAGTAMGDWFAENEVLGLGLPLATLITGCTFSALLLFWRRERVSPA